MRKRYARISSSNAFVCVVQIGKGWLALDIAISVALGNPVYHLALSLLKETASSLKRVEVRFCLSCMSKHCRTETLFVEAYDLGGGAGADQSRCWPFLDRRQRERQAYVHRQAFPTRGDKAVRAQSIRGRMALEGLYVPSGAPWVSAFRSEGW